MPGKEGFKKLDTKEMSVETTADVPATAEVKENAKTLQAALKNKLEGMKLDM